MSRKGVPLSEGVVTNLQGNFPEGLGWDFNVGIWDGGNTARRDHFIL